MLFQELEDLRKQSEVIPQLMIECEAVTEKLQVRDMTLLPELNFNGLCSPRYLPLDENKK